MRLQLLATLAAAVALTACESTNSDQKSGMYDWPASSTEGAIPGSAEDFKKNAQDRVFFDLNKHHLSAEAKTVAAAQAEWLKKWPSINAVVEGHCDERGTTEYNMALGDRRATHMKKALVAHGIDAKRLDVVSYGKEHPEVTTGHDEAAWAKNRRAVTVVR